MPLYKSLLNIPYQKKVFYIIKKMRFLYKYRFKTYFRSKKNIKPYKIYWISPNKINYHTNYIKNDEYKEINYAHRVFPENMRGMIINGDWDITNYNIENFYLYESIKDRIIKGKEWKDTIFYKHHLYIINNRHLFDNKIYWNIIDEETLIYRCRFIDGLISDLKENGYILNIKKINNLDFDEIDVNISRDGKYLFQNGRHRLIIAKILKIDKISVTIFVRHKKWEKIRRYINEYSKTLPKNEFYTKLIHPDLNHIKYDEKIDDMLNIIKNNLSFSSGNILDINPIIGFYCHKFEEYGFNCSAYEKNNELYNIITVLKKYDNKNFKIMKELNDEDLIKIDPQIIIYLFTKNNELKKNILFNAIHICPNLKEIYLQHISLDDKIYVLELIDQIKNMAHFKMVSKIYQHQGNCIYKLHK